MFFVLKTLEHTGSISSSKDHVVEKINYWLRRVTYQIEQKVETQRHTGHGEREQQRAEDFVMEAKKEPIDFSVTSGGTTLTTGKNFKDHFLRHKKLLEEALGTNYRKLKADSPRFLEDIAKIIDNGTVKYIGMGEYKEGFPPAKIYRGNGMTIIVKPSGEWVTLLKSGTGMDSKIKIITP